jgi:hypothetical protein
MFEWLGSPIVYLEKSSVVDRMRELTEICYSPTFITDYLFPHPPCPEPCRRVSNVKAALSAAITCIETTPFLRLPRCKKIYPRHPR